MEFSIEIYFSLEILQNKYHLEQYKNYSLVLKSL